MTARTILGTTLVMKLILRLKWKLTQDVRTKSAFLLILYIHHSDHTNIMNFSGECYANGFFQRDEEKCCICVRVRKKGRLFIFGNIL